MSKTALAISRRLKQLGFLPISKTGSHEKYTDKAQRMLILPCHKGCEISKGIIWNINRKLKQWGYTNSLFL